MNGVRPAWRSALPTAAMICLAAAAALAGTLLSSRPFDFAHDLLAPVRDFGIAGSIVFAAAQMMVAVSGILPASLLGVAAGALYGAPAGFVLAAASTLGGAWLAFRLARLKWRPAIAQRMQGRRRLRAFDGRLATEGWRLVALLRLSPAMPFSATSYALGLSAVTCRDYLLGTLACLPSLFGYVMIGALASTGIESPTGAVAAVRPLLMATGAVATVVLSIRIARLGLEALQPLDGVPLLPLKGDTIPNNSTRP